MLILIKTIRSPFVVGFYDRRFLPALFVVISLAQLLNGIVEGWVGVDAEIYYRGSAAWLAGGDPWETYSVIEASGNHYHYSALPTMTILAAPFTLLPESAFVAFVIVTSAAAAFYVVRRLRLRAYWLLFPPLVAGVLSGNPSIILLALLLSVSSATQALAPLLKVYAFIPLFSEGRWKACWLAISGFVVTLVFAWPLWMSYLSDLSSRSERLMTESGGGFNVGGDLALFVMAAAAIIVLIVIDRKAAGWLLVPALWPATQFHYSTLAMPVMHPILAVGLALPFFRLPSLVITAYVLWRVLTLRMNKLEGGDDGTADLASAELP